MSVNRRALLIGAAAGTTAMALPSAAGATVPGYVANRAPLRPDAFLRLPPGAVRPDGWLATQLQYQVDGLCGRMPEVSHFLDYSTNGWVHPDRWAWEEAPYWLRGFGDLGYVTGDPRISQTAQRWIDGVLNTQRSDGFFGPQALRTSLEGGPDLWPHMPMLHALRSYADFSGDGRVVPFLTRFFHFMDGQPAAIFGRSWGAFRWADTIDVVYWLYNRTGDSFLIDLVHRIHQHSANYVNNIPSPHNVNLAQGFREPAQYGVLTGDPGLRAATYNVYNQIMGTWGQFPGGGFAGDENTRPHAVDPRQGFETCGIVEFMQSHEILTRITGDPVWADRTEELAFNSLPAALDPRQKGTHYICSANSIALEDVTTKYGQFQNENFPMQTYQLGIDNYRCCPHNYGQGWPYFVEEMWLATPDNGLCAALYGPCRVTARVADGTAVTFTEETTYPFGETVTLRLSAPRELTFPLHLRVPGWCTGATAQVNGQNVGVSGGFNRVYRTWRDGDVVTLRLPMRTWIRTWHDNHGSVSVHHGALTFSLRIDENWSRFGGTESWPSYEVRPGSAWNYGLVTESPLSVVNGGDVDDPFTPDNAPIRILASAKRIPAWRADRQNIVTQLQDSPVPAESPTEQVTLIPLGSARLRISAFPRIGAGRPWLPPGAWFRVQNRHSGKVLGVDRMMTTNSADVVQYDDNGTADHLWQPVDNEDGWLRVQNLNSGKVLGVDRMSTVNSARVVQYQDNGTADHLWQPVDNGDGWFRLRNRNSGRVLGVDSMSTANSAQVVQYDDNGTADHLWRLIPDGRVRIFNAETGKVLAVDSMANSVPLLAQAASDALEQLWAFVPDTNGYLRIRNVFSGKVVGVAGMSTSNGAQVVQYDDNGTADHLWRLRLGARGSVRLQNANSGKVIADSSGIIQYDDNGAAEHRWHLALG